MLTAWTTSTVATLPEAARLLFQMLCLIEDGDRQSMVVEVTWAGLWRRLDRPGDPPDPAAVLPLLTAAALVHPDAGEKLVRYRIHPGVAEAVRAHAPDDLCAAVDTEFAAWWSAVARHARDRDGGEHTQTVVRAGLAAAAYLLRRHDWETAARLLEHAIHRDQTPAVVQAALPHLQRIAHATGDPYHLGRLAQAMTWVDPVAAERLLLEILDRAVTAQDFRVASTAGGHLANLLRDTGRLRGALAVVDRMAEQTRRAGLGPWTQLAARSHRLQILYRLREREQVLAEVRTLREQMRLLPDQPGANETVIPWNVREATLSTGVIAAGGLGRWQQALDLNAEVLASIQRRGAGDHWIARTRFNDYYPLLELGRREEADTLLRACQHVFEAHQDIPNLGLVLGARADLAGRGGRHAEAASFERTALRLKYVQPDPRAVAALHHNLAGSLARGGVDPAGRIAHRLAAALIYRLTGMHHELDGSVRALAEDLRSLGHQAQPPASVDELAVQIEQVEGVHFAALIHALAPEPGDAEAAVAEIVQAARDLPDERDAEALLAGRDPIDTAIVETTLDRLGAGADPEEEDA
jgi:tetratricopeptide (TPR) repeat protein